MEPPDGVGRIYDQGSTIRFDARLFEGIGETFGEALVDYEPDLLHPPDEADPSEQSDESMSRDKP
jgi:hypothetical protein